jgi:hypothetical protein
MGSDPAVTQFGDIFAGVIASLSDWAIALAVICALAFMLARLRLLPERGTEAAVQAIRVSVLEPERTRAHWARTSAAGRPTLASLQANAASNVDAAEHALNRLLAECAAVMTLPMSPTLEARRELKIVRSDASAPLAA